MARRRMLTYRWMLLWPLALMVACGGAPATAPPAAPSTAPATQLPPTALPTAAPAPPTPAPTATPATAKRREVTVWAPIVSGPEEHTLAANRDVIREINYFWYQLGVNGKIRGQIQNKRAIEDARAAGMRIVPSIVNAAFNPDAVANVIRDPQRRAEHIRDILALVRDSNFDGIDIDYESLYAEDRDAFSVFIEELAAALHAQHKLLSIAVHPKVDEKGDWGGPLAQDWARLGAAVDEFKIMTYDYHSGNSTAGPISPIAWADQVLTYAATLVPPQKTFMGMHFYGYSWVQTSGETKTWQSIQGLLLRYKPMIKRDESNEAWFTYGSGDDQTVYFADALSVETKIKAIFAKHPGLAGIAIWSLGGEDPKNWAVIRDMVMPQT
jgi:spore germination protein YaaH